MYMVWSRNSRKRGSFQILFEDRMLELALPMWFQPWIQGPPTYQWLPNPKLIQISLLRFQHMVPTLYWIAPLGCPAHSPSNFQNGTHPHLSETCSYSSVLVQKLAIPSIPPGNLGAILDCFPVSFLMFNQCQGSVDSVHSSRSSRISPVSPPPMVWRGLDCAHLWPGWLQLSPIGYPASGLVPHPESHAPNHHLGLSETHTYRIMIFLEHKHEHVSLVLKSLWWFPVFLRKILTL